VIETSGLFDSRSQDGDLSLRIVVVVDVGAALSVIEGSWTGSIAVLRARGNSVTGSIANSFDSEPFGLPGG
jgi:hypothetical protein